MVQRSIEPRQCTTETVMGMDTVHRLVFLRRLHYPPYQFYPREEEEEEA